MSKLRVDFLSMGVRNKLDCVEQFSRQSGVSPVQIAYVGDEINDLILVGKVGVFMCPSDGCIDIRSRADVVLQTKGGEGVLREAAEVVLKGQGGYDEALSCYLGGC